MRWEGERELEGSWGCGWVGAGRELGRELGLELGLQLGTEGGGGKSFILQLWTSRIRSLVPKWPFEARAKSRMAPGAGFLYRFKNQNMSYPLPAAGHKNLILVRGFSLKMPFQRTLCCESAWPPPQFHRFPSY